MIIIFNWESYFISVFYLLLFLEAKTKMKNLMRFEIKSEKSQITSKYLTFLMVLFVQSEKILIFVANLYTFSFEKKIWEIVSNEKLTNDSSNNR